MRKRNKKKSVKIRWIIALLLIVLPLFYFGRRVYILIRSRNEEYTLTKRAVILKAECEALRQRISAYKRGTILEAKARDELGMIKKDEKVYVVPTQ
jgi:cell division protein FtsB